MFMESCDRWPSYAQAIGGFPFASTHASSTLDVCSSICLLETSVACLGSKDTWADSQRLLVAA